MGVLQQAATAICEHLHACHAKPDRMCVDVPGWQQRREELIHYIAATGMLPRELGHYESQSTWLHTPLQISDGHMRWWEEWWYPPVDLLLRLQMHLPIYPQGGLSVVLEHTGRQLLALIPLVSREHWFDPRWHWDKGIRPFQQQHGVIISRRAEIARRQQMPIVCATAQTQVAEVLTQLVLVAQRADFPTAPGDDTSAHVWIQNVIRSGLRTGGQMVNNLTGEVYEALRQRFYWPAGPGGFQAFIQATAKGLAKTALAKSTTQGSPGTWNDPVSGEPLYSDAWVVQACGVSPRTVARWRKSKGITRQGLSESQWIDFRQKREPKRQRAELRATGAQLGLKQDAVKQIIYRGKKARQSPEDIKAALKRNAARQKRREAEAAVPSQDTVSIEDQRAAWEACYAEATPGSDEWCDARDALEQLQRRQEGAQP